MKKEVKIGVLVLGLILLLSISYVLYNNGLMNYLIITGTFSVICAIVLVNTLITTRSDEAQYRSKLRQILRTYDSILVKSKNLPKLDNFNIIRVDTIEDLVDAQMEIRKPIYYQEQVESCAFVLLDNMTACFYTLKVNDSVLCPLEITINELDIKNKSSKKDLEDDIPEDLLSEIERTTIIRLKKGKYLKVSPMRRTRAKNASDEIKDKVEEKTQEIKRAVDEKVLETKEIVKDTKEKIEKTIENSKEKANKKAEEIKEEVEEIVEKADEIKKEATDKISDKKEEIVTKVDEIKEIANNVKDNVKTKADEIKESIQENSEVAKEVVEDAKDKVADKIEDTKEIIEEKTSDIKEVVEDKIDEVSEKVEEIKQEINHANKKKKTKKQVKKIANKAIDTTYKVRHTIEDLTFEDERNIVEKTIDKVDEEVDKAKTKAKVDKKIDQIVDNIADLGKKDKPKEKKKREIEDLDF